MELKDVFELKKSGEKLYQISFPDGETLFKLIPYQEFIQLREIYFGSPAFSAELENYIWDNYVIKSTYDKATRNARAGIVTTISNVIFTMSGPSSLDGYQDYLDKNAERLSLDDFMKGAISSHFHIPIDKINSMPVDEVFKLFALYKKFTGNDVNFKEQKPINKPFPVPDLINEEE